MLLTGITIEKLSYGIILGVGISVGIIAYVCIKNKSFAALFAVYRDEKGQIDLGLYLFLFAYFFIFASNVGKHYNMWDEFSHWGWFVRESYNNDFLYCISQKYFEHKEYVPGVTLFETLWCRLSLKYSEPNAYRGIQMLQASMLLPVVSRISSGLANRFERVSRRILLLVVNAFIVFSIPLFSQLPFYHTLYEDLILGVFVYYCIWITVSEEISGYSLLLLGLTLCNMTLCKLTAVAFIPILFLLYVVYHHVFADKSISRLKIWVGTTVATVISIIPWRLYSLYNKNNGVNSGSQNYGSIRLSSILDVITHNGKISYQDETERNYLVSLAQKGIIGNLSYIWIVIGCTILLVLLMLVVEGKTAKKKIGLISLWVFLAGVYYGILMYFMYMLMFSEYEATGIASYSRYMSTYVLIALLIVAMCFIVFGTARYRFVTYLAAILLAENIVVFFGAYQVLPGIFTHDEVWYEGHVEYLNNAVEADTSLLFITSAADLDAPGRVRFYCDNFTLTGGTFGVNNNSDDVWTQNLSTDEFVEKCSGFDYIYFFSYDEDFPELYETAFEDDGVIGLGKLYKIEKVDGKIRTYPVG